MGTVSKLKDGPEGQLKLPGIREEARNSIFPEDFLWFWSEYPSKKAKLDALKAWRQTAELRPDIEMIIAAIHKQKGTEQWHQGYVPMPATWLRGGRWDDE